MIVTLSPLRQRLLAVGLAAVVLLGFVMLFVVPAVDAVALHEEHVGMLRAKARKLEALIEAGPRYSAVAREMAEAPEVATLAFAATEPRLAVAELQSTVNRIFAAAGAAVTRGEALPADDANRRIAVRLTLQTTIGALVRGLHAAASERPLLTVEQLSAREPDGAFANLAAVSPSAPNELTVEVVVSAEAGRPW